MEQKLKFLIATLGLILSCNTSSDLLPDQSQPSQILFIGNSYTYVNDLPGMVEAMARQVGVHLDVSSVVAGGVSLEDHWNDGTARSRLESHRWDVVILQQGPSSLPESRVNLLEYATLFAPIIRSAGARPAFYSVWPEQARMSAYDAALESYTIAADSIHAMLFPASEAWRAAWRKDSTLELYGPDGLHPTVMGTYLVALGMVSQITGKPVTDLPSMVEVVGPAGYTFSPPPGIARLLKEAAAEAITNFGRR